MSLLGLVVFDFGLATVRFRFAGDFLNLTPFVCASLDGLLRVEGPRGLTGKC